MFLKNFYESSIHPISLNALLHRYTVKANTRFNNWRQLSPASLSKKEQFDLFIDLSHKIVFIIILHNEEYFTE